VGEEGDDGLLKSIEIMKVLIKIKQAKTFRGAATAPKMARKTYELTTPTGNR